MRHGVKWAIVAATVMALTACTKGKESPQVTPITSFDKALNCRQLQMEISDAHYVVYRAQKNRGMRLNNFLWPFGYPATYLSADQSISQAQERLGYLHKIAQVKGCEIHELS